MATIVAYWGDHKDVLFSRLEETGSALTLSRHDTLFGCMEAFVAHGHVSELLDYIPDWDERDPQDLCDQWREQLRAQGYEISRGV